MTNSYETIESEGLLVGNSMAEGGKKFMSKWKVAGIAAAVALLFVGAVAWTPNGQNTLLRGLFVSSVPLDGINAVYPGETIDFLIPHSGIWQVVVEGNAGYGVKEGNVYFEHFWDDGNSGVKFRSIQGPSANGRPVMYFIVGGNNDKIRVNHNFDAAATFSAKVVPSLPDLTIEIPENGSGYQDWDGPVKASEQLTVSAAGMEKGSAHVLKCNLYRDDAIGVVADYMRDVPNQVRANLGVWDIQDIHCYVWNLGPDHTTLGGYGPPAIYP